MAHLQMNEIDSEIVDDMPRPMCLTCHYFGYEVQPVAVCNRNQSPHGWADVCLHWQGYQKPDLMAA
jgi:hypothetical protein